HDPTERLRALQQSASREHRALRHAALFISVAAMIVGNVLVPLIFIPLMLALKGWFLYALITLTGFGMGLLFEILTRSIASLGQHHHILLGMLVPLCAIVGVLFIADFANDIASGFGIGSTHSPQLVAAAYALAFLAPYAHYRFVLRKRHYLG
ncbi:TPA: hypothetical protein HA372_03160, partial [Candidatus Woesearchaeota archaeon]|nr:hypothetical protein [Candidatus Woesearchaeota archaeon]